MNQLSFARRACLALALAATAGTAVAGSANQELCGGSSTACLEQMSAVLDARGAGDSVERAPRPRHVARREQGTMQVSAPRLNLEQRLRAPDDSEDGGT